MQLTLYLGDEKEDLLRRTTIQFGPGTPMVDVFDVLTEKRLLHEYNYETGTLVLDEPVEEGAQIDVRIVTRWVHLNYTEGRFVHLDDSGTASSADIAISAMRTRRSTTSTTLDDDS